MPTFPKRERLNRKKEIDCLFRSGARSLLAFPIRTVFIPIQTEGETAAFEKGISVLINVSKRYLRHAVDRNRVKRQLREAYRRNKTDFMDKLPADLRGLRIAFLWIDGKHHASAEVEAKMKNLLIRIVESMQKESVQL